MQTQVRRAKRAGARKSGVALAVWPTGQVSPWLRAARLSSRPVPQPGWAGAATAGAGPAGAAVSAEAGAAPARARAAIAKSSIPNAFFTFMVSSSKKSATGDRLITGGAAAVGAGPADALVHAAAMAVAQ